MIVLGKEFKGPNELLKKMKPRIYFRKGYWRVSHMPRPWNHRDQPAWNAAHMHAVRLNNINRSHQAASRCRCCGAH